ncbi:hypothetical protein DIPPA_35338 [Diplonema papillatum]|nr:hypothetical protein DIPPA_35338 [Diplonema papillatum]
MKVDYFDDELEGTDTKVVVGYPIRTDDECLIFRQRHSQEGPELVGRFPATRREGKEEKRCDKGHPRPQAAPKTEKSCEKGLSRPQAAPEQRNRGTTQRPVHNDRPKEREQKRPQKEKPRAQTRKRRQEKSEERPRDSEAKKQNQKNKKRAKTRANRKERRKQKTKRPKSDTRFLAAFVHTRRHPDDGDDDHGSRRRSAIENFWKRYGTKVSNGRNKCGTDRSDVADSTTGVIYVLLNEGGTVLYVGQTSKTAEMRNSKHWENRNSKGNRVSQQLRKRGRKLYACPIQNVPERLYVQPADFARVALPIEDFWIKWLNPPLNMTNRRHGERVNRKAAKKKKRQRPPQRLRKRRTDGNVWHRMVNGELHIDTSPGFCSGLRKQLDHLLTLPQDRLGTYDMATWHPNRALRLRTWLRTFVRGKDVTEKVRTLERLLSTRIRNRTEKPAAPPRRYFKLTHHHPAQDRTAIAGVLSRARVRETCPNPAVLKNLMVSNRLKPPLVTLVSNVTEVSYEANQPTSSSSVCPCMQHLTPHRADLGGHALGLATDLKTDEALLSLFRKGRKYRVASSPMTMYDSIRHDVEEFVNSNFPKSSEEEKTRFTTTLVEEFDAVLGTLNAHTDEPQLRDAIRTLKKLQEHLVFLPVDKTSHDFGFICKEKYKELLRSELQESSTYQEVGESIEDVLKRHHDFNKSHQFTHTNILPYLYGIPKLHKPEPRMRYIAGVSEKGNIEKKNEQKDRDEKGRDKKRVKTRASTTPAHQEASGLLKLVLATLRSKDEATFSQTGIHRFFVIESVDDVAVHA